MAKKKLRYEMSKKAYIDNDIIRSSDAFRNLNRIQINLFLFICCLAKQKYSVIREDEEDGSQTGWSDEIVIDMKNFLVGSGRKTCWKDLSADKKDIILSWFDSLQEKTFIIYDTAKRRRSDGYTKYNYVNYVRYDNAQKTLKISMPEETRLFFMNYDNYFTAYEIGQIIRLNSEPAKLLYMYLRSFNNGRKGAFLPTSLSLENFRSITGVKGKYKNYYDLKRYVLEKAIEEINEKTDIIVSGDYKTYHNWIDNKSGLTERKKKVYMYKSMELRNDDGEVSGLTFRMKLKKSSDYEDKDFDIFDDDMLKIRMKNEAYLHEAQKSIKNKKKYKGEGNN